MNVTVFCVAGVVAALCAMYIKQVREDYALCVTLAAAVVLFAGILPKVGTIAANIHKFANAGEFPSEYLEPMFKIVGISYVTEFAADICKDAGENTLSVHIETLGKIAVTYIALPIAEDVFKLIIGLLE